MLSNKVDYRIHINVMLYTSAFRWNIIHIHIKGCTKFLLAVLLVFFFFFHWWFVESARILKWARKRSGNMQRLTKEIFHFTKVGASAGVKEIGWWTEGWVGGNRKRKRGKKKKRIVVVGIEKREKVELCEARLVAFVLISTSRFNFHFSRSRLLCLYMRAPLSSCFFFFSFTPKLFPLCTRHYSLVHTCTLTKIQKENCANNETKKKKRMKIKNKNNKRIKQILFTFFSFV